MARAREAVRRRSLAVAGRPRLRTRGERYRFGKELRHKVRRSAQARWAPPRGRADPVELLIRGDRGRAPELLPIRYGRMAASPFGFLRGAAGVMAGDLATMPATGLQVQLVGDAHVCNFGLFATPERDRVFDANDFDETIPGPWEWDLKRLATSVVLVGRQNRLPPGVVRASARIAAQAYRAYLRTAAGARYLDAWYAHLDVEEASHEVGDDALGLLEKQIPEAQRRTSFHLFPKLARLRGGEARIRDDPPLLGHYPDRRAEAEVRELFRQYRGSLPVERRPILDRFHLVDVAQKVVGIGSVGTRCAVGPFLADDDLPEPLFLQVKEARPSVYEAFGRASSFSNHAERVVVGQRLVQEASDIFLGWGSAGGRDFYVRQLRDMKFVSDVSDYGPRELRGEAELCGTALARAHARTGDPAAIAGYLGPGGAFDEAVASFAQRYARQTEDDHAELLRAIDRGRIAAKMPARVGRR